MNAPHIRPAQLHPERSDMLSKSASTLNPYPANDPRALAWATGFGAGMEWASQLWEATSAKHGDDPVGRDFGLVENG